MRAVRLVAVVVLAIAAVQCTFDVWTIGRNAAGIDFYQFWVGGQVAGHAEAFYAPATGARIGDEYASRARTDEPSPRRVAVADFRHDLEWYSTPLQYALFSLASARYEIALLTFQVLSLLSLIAGVAIITRVLGYTLLRAVVLYDALVLAFEPLFSDARVVSVNAPVLLALAIATWAVARRRFMLAGAVLALAVLFKPYVAMILPLAYALLVVERRWRDLRAHVIGAAIGCSIGLLVSAWRFGSFSIWLEWLDALRSMPDSIVTAELGNYALARLVGVPHLGVLLTIGCFLVAVAAFALRRTGTDESAIGLGAVNSFLGAPLVWPHYLLLTVPLIAWLLRSGDRARNLAGGGAFVLIAILPWSFLGVTDARVEAAIVNIGLVIAFAAELLLPRRSSAPAQPASVASNRTRQKRRGA